MKALGSSVGTTLRKVLSEPRHWGLELTKFSSTPSPIVATQTLSPFDLVVKGHTSSPLTFQRAVGWSILWFTSDSAINSTGYPSKLLKHSHAK